MTKNESDKMVTNCEGLPPALLEALRESPPDRLTEGKKEDEK
jgi:hypothetical protein